MTSALYTHEPREDESRLARKALVQVRRVLDDHPHEDEPVHLTLEEGQETVTVPRVVLALLVRVLANLAAGQGVTLVPAHAELTTQQAADLLNVSRPYLIKLLDEHKIAYRTVGTHRRITASSLMDYKARDDAERRKAADELAAMTREMGFD
ncbi:MAG: helix-turn-helix domain-containing protein [bacterium]|nr:helix-turn-helix domain-containing protein [bacterium]